jgi:hypothetical protein
MKVRLFWHVTLRHSVFPDVPSKLRERLAERRSVTCQKNGILNILTF